MCNGCYGVTGFQLDTYAAALADSTFPLDKLPPKLRQRVLEYRALTILDKGSTKV